MNTITFAVKNVNGYSHKLVVCHQTKQYERGQCCINTNYTDVWLKSQKDLDTIEKHLISIGYTKTDNEFGKENE